MKKIYLVILSTITLSACSGGSSSSSSSNTNNGDVTRLEVTTPYVIPVTLYESGYGVALITNPTTSTISNIQYTIQNIAESGSNALINSESAAACTTIAAGASCALQLILPPGTQGGSFGVSISNAVSATNKARLDDISVDTKSSPTMGTQPVAYTNDTGLKAVQIYNYAAILGSVGLISDILVVSGVITNITSIESIALVDINGNNISVSPVFSSNPLFISQPQKAGYSFTFLPIIPKDVKGLAFYLKVTNLDGSSSVSEKPYIISTVPASETYVTYYPQTLDLKNSSTSSITLSNYGPISATKFTFSCSNQIKITSNVATQISSFGTENIMLQLSNPASPSTASSCSFSYYNGGSMITESVPVNINQSQLAPTPTPTPIIFVTNGVWDGNLGGSSGADSKCNSDGNKPLAYAAVTFKALLAGNNSTSTGTTYYQWDQITPIATATTGNLTCEDIGLCGSDLTNAFTTSSYSVWTGASGEDCLDWTSSASGIGGGSGVSNATNSTWYNNYLSPQTCNAQLHLYCVSQ